MRVCVCACACVYPQDLDLPPASRDLKQLLGCAGEVLEANEWLTLLCEDLDCLQVTDGLFKSLSLCVPK
jgi:hypothetical protein